jgi:hypothetical protein
MLHEFVIFWGFLWKGAGPKIVIKFVLLMIPASPHDAEHKLKLAAKMHSGFAKLFHISRQRKRPGAGTDQGNIEGEGGDFLLEAIEGMEPIAMLRRNHVSQLGTGNNLEAPGGIFNLIQILGGIDSKFG